MQAEKALINRPKVHKDQVYPPTPAFRANAGSLLIREQCEAHKLAENGTLQIEALCPNQHRHSEHQYNQAELPRFDIISESPQAEPLPISVRDQRAHEFGRSPTALV